MPTDLILAAAAAAAACVTPPGSRDAPPPTLAPLERLVAHTEELIIARPLAVVQQADAVPLEQAVQGDGDLPRVIATRNLSPAAFPAPGARRLVCLSDGSTLLEQSLVRESSPGVTRFRYMVWSYTSETARPIRYGVGEFRHTELPGGRTHIRWTYGFQLREDRFPGVLGPVGAWLFRTTFLERSYAAMMRASLAGTKARAEAWRDR
jgi:hypothetical protein